VLPVWLLANITLLPKQLLQQVCSSAPQALSSVHSLPPACCLTPLLSLLLLSPLFALPQALQKTTPLMRAQQAVKYTGQRTNFFSLLRFDFMLDENLDTYLIEVGSVCMEGVGMVCAVP
jgi:hypothetical protein